MRLDMVMVLDQLPDDDLGFLRTVEDLPIQKVIPNGAVKALTIAIFPRGCRVQCTRFSRQCQITNCVALWQ